MSFIPRRRYDGPVRAAIFDWAGTTVDFGCQAPITSLVEAFAAMGVEVPLATARLPMGMAKRDHIRALLEMPQVAAAWERAQGRAPAPGDVDGLYERFLPLQVAAVRRHAGLIPGTIETMAALEARGIRIGTTTGFPRPVMQVVIPEAARQGYAPEVIVCAGETPSGRPGPAMALKALIELDIHPVQAAVKVGDTQVDVAEGLNAGMWTIALAVTGNEVGLTAAEWAALPAERQTELRRAAAGRLWAAGAHEVVDGIADVPAAIERIEARIAAGDVP
ncbi:phosphonoacetaldehyde hydrolase [Inquilinus sp. Marseille-Q2685]|uniref:phosphonoacetaldehyde hydrolase n=1 Tax=Inquilinus sp. Marseille-Q2685 TaxID=2866581 RepID=UPI001CE3CD1B|nr:phosphonoacetaldehyde hydrolase [Inquilinus sp. Marseille-Q2685]